MTIAGKRLALSLATFGVVSGGYAQNQYSGDGKIVEEAVVEEVVVTGTRQAQRTQFDTMAPVDVLSESAIGNTVSDELMDSLAQLVPSFNVKRLPMADGQIFIRPATLRGLSADHTLVLVNGKRRHRSVLLDSNGAQAVDLAQIPLFAIQRIEVLRDGAAAQYGSDAIAGVINIILDDKPGFDAFNQYSEYREGDGEQWRAGGQWGTEFEGGGFFNAALEWTDAEATSRSRQRPDAIEFQNAHPEVAVANPVQNWGQPERDALRLGWNAELPLSERFQGYAFGSYGEGSGVSDFNWRNPDDNSVFNPSPTAFPDFDLTELYPTGFTPRFGQEDEDLSLVLGARAALSEVLSMDISASYGRNQVDYSMDNSINASLGPQSPTSFYLGSLSQREINTQIDFVYQWAAAPLAEPINVAFGAERREETYGIEAGDPASYAIGPAAVDGLPSAANGFPGFSEAQAGDYEQHSYAAYVDIEIPLAERFTLGVAGRYEDYSEFGDTLDGKVSARYEITPDLAFRTTVSSGFRAPTPAQLFSEKIFQGLDTNTLDIFTSGRFSTEGPVADIISRRDGIVIDALTPEESFNYSVGFAYRHASGFSASIDFYQIQVDDRFGLSQRYTLTAEERAALAALNVPGADSITSVSFFQNDFDTETRGMDIVASYGFALGSGTIALSAAYNHNTTEVVGGNLLSDNGTRRQFEERLPENNASIGIDYLIGAWQLNSRARYYGSWTDFSGNADGDIFQRFGSEVFIDLSLGYRIDDSYTLRFGGENIFDTYPDEATFQANRGLIYSRNAPYDTDGAQYYLRLDVAL